MASTKPREMQTGDALHRPRRVFSRARLKAVLIAMAALLLAIAGLIAGQINVDVMN